MTCEVYAIVGDGEKQLLGKYEFLLAPVPGDQVQVADAIYVVHGRRIHDLEGDFRGLVEVFVK